MLIQFLRLSFIKMRKRKEKNRITELEDFFILRNRKKVFKEKISKNNLCESLIESLKTWVLLKLKQSPVNSEINQATNISSNHFLKLQKCHWGARMKSRWNRKEEEKNSISSYKCFHNLIQMNNERFQLRVK